MLPKLNLRSMYNERLQTWVEDQDRGIVNNQTGGAPQWIAALCAFPSILLLHGDNVVHRPLPVVWRGNVGTDNINACSALYAQWGRIDSVRNAGLPQCSNGQGLSSNNSLYGYAQIKARKPTVEVSHSLEDLIVYILAQVSRKSDWAWPKQSISFYNILWY